MYIILSFFCLIIACLLSRFNSYTPDDYGKLGRINMCLGIILKLIPGLLMLTQYAIVIMLIVQFILIGAGDCFKDNTTFGSNAIGLNAICFIIFLI